MNASQVLKRIVEDLREKDDNAPFVEKFIEQQGYPIWEKAEIRLPLANGFFIHIAVTTNGLRAGDRNPVLRLRQGYGACTLLVAVFYVFFSLLKNKMILLVKPFNA